MKQKWWGSSSLDNSLSVSLEILCCHCMFVLQQLLLVLFTLPIHTLCQYPCSACILLWITYHCGTLFPCLLPCPHLCQCQADYFVCFLKYKLEPKFKMSFITSNKRVTWNKIGQILVNCEYFCSILHSFR